MFCFVTVNLLLNTREIKGKRHEHKRAVFRRGGFALPLSRQAGATALCTGGAGFRTRCPRAYRMRCPRAFRRRCHAPDSAGQPHPAARCPEPPAARCVGLGLQARAVPAHVLQRLKPSSLRCPLELPRFDDWFCALYSSYPGATLGKQRQLLCVRRGPWNRPLLQPQPYTGGRALSSLNEAFCPRDGQKGKGIVSSFLTVSLI